MEKKEYIKKLREYTKRNGMSIADYYFLWSLTIRTKKQFSLPEFELENPFLTAEDYQKLIDTNDQRIVEYYAHVMEKTVELSSQEETLSRKEIEEAIDEEMPKEPTREEITEAIDESFEKDGVVSREEIEEAINEELEDTKEEPKIQVVMTSINGSIADLLNGFAVVRESKTGRAHLYHHDAKKDSLTGEQVFRNNQLKADSGYYVNFEEYIDTILDEIAERYPYPEEIMFVRDDGLERKLSEVVEEAFAIGRQHGAIRFGKNIQGKEINSYSDLVKLHLESHEEPYGEETLRPGIYVRRDILTRIFAKYQAKVIRLEEEIKQPTK